ncbi:lactonase family protein [Actinospica sp.]|jgi:6-phosphogluconolactonase|uniref:lactonase family protein n=1 Tax=Actinospica sp. TaxID=1872142 RepID=UPI002C56431A|nr:lactonase family protein [Actinospica sp.]HWG23894.1 lactonase family protein [Actinospica sp.]
MSTNIELLIGSYTEGPSPERGIFRATVTPDGSRIELRGVTPIAPNVDPTWLTAGADGRFVYAACEGERGAVLALALDETGDLSVLNAQPTGGSGTCHLAVVNGGTHLVAADYVSGSVSAHPIAADGTVGEQTTLVQHVGSGPYIERQAGPHAHMIAEDPDGRFVHAIDLGTDTVYAYALDAENGALIEASRTTLRPAFGPRHVAFHPNGELAYIIGELGFEVAVCEYDAATGRLHPLAYVPIVEDGVLGEDFPSGIRVSPDGRFLHLAVRGPDTIRTYALVDPRKPELVSVVPTGGKWPRDIVLSPDGTLLFCSNQLSDEVTVFALDPATGTPSATGAALDVPAPSCVIMR